MRKIISIIALVMFVASVQGQDDSLFDFQIVKNDDVNYEMSLQLSENSNVQYIQIHFLDITNILAIDEASLNKKSDGKYYLYFENEENEVFLDNIELSLNHDFGLISNLSVIVKLIDKDFNTIDSYQQIID